MITLIWLFVFLQVYFGYSTEATNGLEWRTAFNNVLQPEGEQQPHEFAEVTDYAQNDDAPQSQSSYIYAPKVLVPKKKVKPVNYEFAIDVTEAEKKRNNQFLLYNGKEYEKPAILPGVEDFGLLQKAKQSKIVLEENNSSLTKKGKEKKLETETKVKQDDAEQKSKSVHL